MSADHIKTICAVGTGAMGAGVALCFAASGYHVQLYGRTEKSLEEGHQNIKSALQDLVKHGFIPATETAAVLGRIKPTTDLATAARNADIVIESVSENLSIKQGLFAQLDKLCPPHTIFGTNTSSLSPTKIADVVSDARKPNFVGIHLFNPPHLMSLVEVIAGQHTTKSTMDTSYHLMEKIGKDPVRLEQEIPGYIVNRVQAAMWMSAYRLVEKGMNPTTLDRAVKRTMGQTLTAQGILNSTDFPGQSNAAANIIQTDMRNAAQELCAKKIASPTDVDRAVGLTLGLRLPHTGPVLSADITGLDVVHAILESLRPSLFNNAPIPAPLITAVAAGHLGAKTQQGLNKMTGEEWAAIKMQRGNHIVQDLKTRKGLEKALPNRSHPPASLRS